VQLDKEPSPINVGLEVRTNKPSSPKERRIQDALKLAEVAYDLYKKRKNDATIAPVQTNANQTGGTKG